MCDVHRVCSQVLVHDTDSLSKACMVCMAYLIQVEMHKFVEVHLPPPRCRIQTPLYTA